MRVLIVAPGSRGDVAPFTGLGSALRTAGHEVTIAGYAMSGGLVTGSGLGFRPLPGDPRLLDAASWRQRGSGPVGAARLIRLIADHMRELHAGILTAARQDADVLLLSGISYAGGFHIGTALGLPSIGLVLAPVYPTRDFPPSILTARNLGRTGNLAAGQILALLAAPALARPVKELRAELGLSRVSSRQAIIGLMDADRWPVFHGFSPSVVPRPADWRPGLEVAGYWWPASPRTWTPPPELADFLAAGPAPVFAGLGSMAPRNAARLSDVIAEAARQAGTRVVIQAGRAGLTRPDEPPGQSILIGDVPHDWLFPQMAALVHHAGAGTTAAGLRAGVPAIGVPMIGDQPFWAARLAALGTGPRPIPLRRLTAPALAAALRDATTRPSYRHRARDLAARIAGEDGTRPVAQALSRLPS
ncbi:MAG TPA: glycosyltransferase [Streptosporangiaceae bacterium]|nr:glycosyltransferase [Streptosporangiaceae bacterium]